MNFIHEYLKWFSEAELGPVCGWVITCGICILLLIFMYIKVTKGPYE